jgi:hypothetical protein
MARKGLVRRFFYSPGRPPRDLVLTEGARAAEAVTIHVTALKLTPASVARALIAAGTRGSTS